jgi:hypothetical protein
MSVPAKDHFLIWDAVSMAWTEVGLLPDDYPKIAAKLRSQYSNWREIAFVVDRDVVWSFALDSCWFVLLATILISPLPDWGYDETELRKKMHRWYRKPRWWHLLNPLRWLGYPVALAASRSLRSKLRRAFDGYS